MTRQPLKRFTQCGSLTMLFGVFIVLFGVSSTALTTFGKTNQQPPPPTPGPIIKGRECHSHDDCAAIDKSSCVKDPDDHKLRCLCGDDTSPNNGLCPDVPRGLRHKCNSINDCDEGMVCQFENGNRSTAVAKFISSKTKLCLCDNESGYVEDLEHDICSGAVMSAIVNMMLPFIAAMLVYSHMKLPY